MNRVLWNRRLRQLHYWLALAIGAQVVIWLASGLFMTWFPIEQVRGEHLRAPVHHSVLDWPNDALEVKEAIAASNLKAHNATAGMLGATPVWRIQAAGTRVILDAQTGERLSPLLENDARRLATDAYRGGFDITSATLLETPPQEYGRAGPVWRIDFSGPQDASFYVDASTGEVTAVRTRLWRAFDFMWGLHIMDWSSRENFNSWWIKMTASLAVIFALAGVAIAVLRMSTSLLRR